MKATAACSLCVLSKAVFVFVLGLVFVFLYRKVDCVLFVFISSSYVAVSAYAKATLCIL